MPILSRRSLGNVLLLLTALIWGAAFVAQRFGMDHLGPFAFNGLRSLLAGIVLLPVLWGAHRGRIALGRPASDHRALWRAGPLCGLCLFVAASTQQIGLMTSSAGHGGFITALYILIVPLMSLALHHPVRPLHLFCVALGVVGLYFLCATGGFSSIGRGDWWLLACAFTFSFHILVVAHYAPRVNPIALSILQFLVVGVLSLPFIPFEPQLFGSPAFAWTSLRAAAIPFFYAAICSSAVGYTLQIVGQRYTDPTVASLLMCLESVFAVLVGCLFGERLTPPELFGCLLLFIAILLAQLPRP